MNTEQQKYIENNIDLIENNDWDRFFLNAPEGIGSYLYYASIDFMLEMKAVPGFCFCGSNIDNLTIPNGVTKIGWFAFQNCSRLKSIAIPDSVTHIDAYAFYGCSSLESITIPEGVTTINKFAFAACTSLQTVNFTGTTEQWRQIPKYKNDFKFKHVPAKKVICSDGVTNLR